MDRASQVKKYFAGFPKGAVWGIIIGGVMTLFIASNVLVGLIGLAIAALSVWVIISHFQKPSDQQMDAWTEDSLKKLRAQAIHKIGTDPSELVSDPVEVTGLVSDVEWPAGTFTGFKTGKDNVFRFTPIDVTIVNFTQNQLLVYQCALDLTTGNPLSERTDEYFYRDVVSVSTVTESANVRVSASEVRQAKAAETFKLTTSGGTSVKVTLSDPEFIKAVGGGGTIPKTRSDRAIQTVRKMLREKKGTPVPA